MTDVLDGPMGSLKKRGADPHVSELQARLRERKKLGLTHDLSDSDVLEDNDDGESDDDILNQYRLETSSHHKRTDRPSSAKRRSPVSTYDSGISLGDTLRPGQGNRFMKTLSSSTSQRKSEMPSIASPKQSPKDKKDRTSPTDSMSYDMKEAIIMNRKTPTKDMDQRHSPVDFSKPWQPPSYRKVSGVDESGDSSTSGFLRGRKTPQDPLLESISETPSPRIRKQSPNSDKKMPSLERRSPGIERKSPGLDRKSPGMERKSPGMERKSPGLDRKSPSIDRKLRESPKPLNLDDPLMSGLSAAPRPKLKTDVFGSSATLEHSLDEDPTPKPRKPRPGIGGKTPTAIESETSERKTADSTRFGGRKTPTEKERFSGRKTPTGRTTPTFLKKTPSEKAEEKQKETPEKRSEPSLMDFLASDVSEKDKQKRGKSSLFDNDDNNVDHKQKVKPTQRIRPENQKETEPEADSFEALLAKKSYNKYRKPEPDESSLCEEYEHEPGLKKSTDLQQTQEQSLRSYSNQRSDKQQAEDAIDLVAGEQNAKIKPIERPESAKKTTGKVVKPKPRHSLPGTPTPSLTLSETTFNDTKSLRDAIFNEWKKERTKSLIHKTAEEKKKQEEEEKKKKEEANNKKVENEIAFKTWKEQKEPVIKSKVKEKLKEEKKKNAEKEEAEQKKKEAEKEFKKWKELNDEKLKEKEREKKRAEMKKKQEEEEKKRQKEKDNESALRVWKSKKENVIKNKIRQENETKKHTIKMHEDEKKKKEEEAREQYEKWLQNKEKQKVTEKKIKYSSMESLDERPAWSPASRTIPHGR